MMPRKMAEYHEPFNNVTQDYISHLRSCRSKDDLYLDIANSLNKWSLECECYSEMDKVEQGYLSNRITGTLMTYF